MATLLRLPSKDRYRIQFAAADVSLVANREKTVPRQWINREGNGITREMTDYLTPLMEERYRCCTGTAFLNISPYLLNKSQGHIYKARNTYIKPGVHIIKPGTHIKENRVGSSPYPILQKFNLFFPVHRYLEAGNQFIITFFTQIKMMDLSVLLRKIIPCMVNTDTSFPDDSMLHHQLFPQQLHIIVSSCPFYCTFSYEPSPFSVIVSFHSFPYLPLKEKKERNVRFLSIIYIKYSHFKW